MIKVNQSSCESIGATNSDGVISIPDDVTRLTEMLSDEYITIAKGPGAPSLVLKDEALAT